MSVYRGAVCADCHGEGRITSCSACGGAGTLPCDLCHGNGVRRSPDGPVPCVCQSGYFTCAACSGGTGVCGGCGGSGVR